MPQKVDLATETRALRQRLSRSIRQGTSELGAEPLSIDTSLYTDPKRHTAEHTFVFRRTPLVVGLSREVAEPGSTLRFDAYGPPVIVSINREEDLPTITGAWRNYTRLQEPMPLIFGRNEMLLQSYHRDIAEACACPCPCPCPCQ